MMSNGYLWLTPQRLIYRRAVGVPLRPDSFELELGRIKSAELLLWHAMLPMPYLTLLWRVFRVSTMTGVSYRMQAAGTEQWVEHLASLVAEQDAQPD